MAYGNANNVGFCGCSSSGDGGAAAVVRHTQWLFPGPCENEERSTRAAKVKSDCYRIHEYALLRYVSAVLSHDALVSVFRAPAFHQRVAGFYPRERGLAMAF